MPDPDPILVQEEESGNYGLYHPDDNRIETYIGNDKHEVYGEYYGETWHDADYDIFQDELHTKINDVQEDIQDLRGRELTAEQETELDRLESRLTSYEKFVDIAREADE
jgi:hypothetical protein